MNKENEYILCAAIYSGEVDLAGQPLIHCGHRHANILWQSKLISRHLEHQGFITNKGRFVGRKEALEIAVKNNQLINPARSELYSEDIY